MVITILQLKDPASYMEGQNPNRKNYTIVSKTTPSIFSGNPGIEDKVLLAMLFDITNRGDVVMFRENIYINNGSAWERTEWKDK